MKTLPHQKDNLFIQAAWFLNDYVDILNISIGNEAKTLIEDAREVIRRLLELNGKRGKKRHAGSAVNAAHIIKDMLDDWGLPGTVYYHPERKRYRVVGEGYRPSSIEICVGCYLPSVTADELFEDFKVVEKEGAL